MKEFQAESSVLESTAEGPIIELRFEGKDRSSKRHTILPFLVQQLSEHCPVGLVLNFQKYRYLFSDDIGRIIAASVKAQQRVPPPCALVVKRSAVRRLNDHLTITCISDAFPVQAFDIPEDGLAFVRKNLSG